MPFSDNQLLARFLCDTFKLKLNPIAFKKQLGLATNLLVKYKLEDLCSVIYYLSLHPPKEGLKSLAYLPYVYEDIMPKIKAQREIKRMVYVENDNTVKGIREANQILFNKKQNTMKGLGKF